MTWYIVYDTATGALQSVGETLADPLSSNLTAVDAGATRPDGPGKVWDATSKAFVAAPVETLLTPYEFVSLFTDTELSGIYTAAQSNVSVSLYLEKLKFAQEVNLSDPVTIASVNALATAGLITTARATEVLAYVKPAS